MDSGYKCWLCIPWWLWAGDCPGLICYKAGLAKTVLKQQEKHPALFSFAWSFCYGSGSTTTLECQAPGEVSFMNVCSAASWDGDTQNLSRWKLKKPRLSGAEGRDKNQVQGCPTQSGLIFRSLKWPRKRETESGTLERGLCERQWGWLSMFCQINSSLPLPPCWIFEAMLEYLQKNIWN